MVVSIDPHGVQALSTATLGVAALIEADGDALQGEVDAVDHLVGRRPDLRGRVAAVTGDLAELAGWAREVVLRFLEDERPINAMRELGYWLPDFSRLGWDADLTPGENLERTARSDELGSFVLGTGEGTLERYRRFPVYVLREGAPVPSLAPTKPVTVFRGVPMVDHPSGIVVPQYSLADPAVEQLRQIAAGPTFSRPGDRTFVVDPKYGSPPTWARIGGRSLSVVGAGLSVYDGYRMQWERDAIENPDWSTGQRVASASYSAAWEGGGAVGGGIAGAKVGAFVGSFIPIPVVGTAGGAIVGGAIGAFVGSKAGRWAGDGAKEAAGWLGDTVKGAWNSLFG